MGKEPVAVIKDRLNAAVCLYVAEKRELCAPFNYWILVVNWYTVTLADWTILALCWVEKLCTELLWLFEILFCSCFISFLSVYPVPVFVFSGKESYMIQCIYEVWLQEKELSLSVERVVTSHYFYVNFWECLFKDLQNNHVN